MCSLSPSSPAASPPPAPLASAPCIQESEGWQSALEQLISLNASAQQLDPSLSPDRLLPGIAASPRAVMSHALWAKIWAFAPPPCSAPFLPVSKPCRFFLHASHSFLAAPAPAQAVSPNVAQRFLPLPSSAALSSSPVPLGGSRALELTPPFLPQPHCICPLQPGSCPIHLSQAC